MSRDVLIVLLVVGLAANVALLALVAYVNHRAAKGWRPGVAGDPGAPVAADDTDPARLLALGAGLVDPDWIDTRRTDRADPEPEPGPPRPVAATTGRERNSPTFRPPASGPRRRHRARRPAGAPVPRTDIVVSLSGQAPDVRIVHALSAALRDAVRPSDKVVDLPGGRVRIILETDALGCEAFVERARNAVRPWLTALDPNLELRVERPRPPRRRETAAP